MIVLSLMEQTAILCLQKNAEYQLLTMPSRLPLECNSGPTEGYKFPCQPGLLADDAVALFKQFYSRENSKGNRLNDTNFATLLFLSLLIAL